MIRFGLAVLALVLLPACSAIKLGYQQLPTLSYWWLDSTVSFSNAQTPAAKEAIDKLYQWHRREELAGYGEVLQRIGQLSTGPLQAEQVCSVVTDVQARLDVLMRQAVVQAAPVVLVLGPRQLSHIARQWESKNEDWEKEWLQGDAQARLDRRLDRAVNRFNSFYGDLNPTQVSMVRAQLAQSPWTAEWGRRDRQRRQQDLLSTLQRIAQSGMPTAQAEALLWSVWQRWLQPIDPAQRAVLQSLSQRACENLAQLHNTTTPEQRVRVARRLRAYERDIQDLTRP
ncbi:DUF6279 family lipoprotein [Limnohabitans sp. Rim28]|uniref:DUF6279 family lipoprotein n=1 Tax=Limnohabitans sp. Rim28 TaxID=1100720 RepID=UPI0002EE6FF3|nr:DUF6279 family lipoprotein [Limnohabitans sp. Rim28]PVE07683.1 hypothetical protein B472_07320 [Limnohabitans sp. Rim28]